MAANFCGIFWGLDLPDGCQERWIRQEALISYSMPQVTDLFGGESALFSAKLKFGVSQSLDDLAEAGKVFFPGGGEHDDVIEVKETRLPVKTGGNAIHEAGEGSGSVAEAKGDLIKLKELATASTECCLLLIPLHDGDLPVSTPEIKYGKPASPVYCVEKVVDAGERMCIFDGRRVELSKIHAKTQTAVLLFDHHHR